jgi:hypothetical protein
MGVLGRRALIDLKSLYYFFGGSVPGAPCGQFSPTKDCTAAMGYCMAIDYDTRVGVSPQPPQDGRRAIFVPASYKNMALGEAQLTGLRHRILRPDFLRMSRSSAVLAPAANIMPQHLISIPPARPPLLVRLRTIPAPGRALELPGHPGPAPARRTRRLPCNGGVLGRRGWEGGSGAR